MNYAYQAWVNMQRYKFDLQVNTDLLILNKPSLILYVGMVPGTTNVLLQHILPLNNQVITVWTSVWHETKITITANTRINEA